MLWGNRFWVKRRSWAEWFLAIQTYQGFLAFSPSALPKIGIILAGKRYYLCD